MAMKKTVSPDLINDLMNGASTQVVSASAPKTDDPNFPVFKTPLDKDIIVYFPRINLTVVDGVETFNPLVAHVHAVRKGAKGFASYRCISGLSGGAFESLGYDGTCPFCDGVSECWDLYNEKMSRKARELNIDLENDVNDTMKPYRQQFSQEMAIKKSDEYVTFPIVIISENGVIPQTLDAACNKPQFVTMRKETFEQKILDVLHKQPTPIAHPCGMFFKWCFTYNTGGKPANVRDAARNAQYLPIVDAASVNNLQSFIPAAEEAGKAFTNAKATEVVIMNEFYEMSQIQAEADSLLADTRRLLTVMKNSVGAAPALPGATSSQPTFGNGVANALASFGVAQPDATATQPAQSAPAQTAQPNPATGAAFAGFGAAPQQ